MNCGNLFLEMSAYFWDFPSWYTDQMAAIITKPSGVPNFQMEQSIITTMKNQTCFEENLQFSFKTEGFQTQLFCWKKPSVL